MKTPPHSPDPRSVVSNDTQAVCIGLVVRKDHTEALSLARKLIEWCASNSYKLIVGVQVDRTASFADIKQSLNAPHVSECELSELPAQCGFICSLGGDGTLISSARFTGPLSPIFLGVHFGTLGFLTEVTPKELFISLEAAIAGICNVSTRSLFTVAIERMGKRTLETQSLNDVVIQKGARSRLIDIDVHAGNQPLMRLRSDGLIVTTPTGSTAYSMAAGGPIIDPSLAAMTLTPICPHSLTSRPLVIGTEYALTISLPHTTDRVFAIIDGVETAELSTEDQVIISAAPHRAKFFSVPGRSYFEALRRKLHWNAPNDGDV